MADVVGTVFAIVAFSLAFYVLGYINAANKYDRPDEGWGNEGGERRPDPQPFPWLNDPDTLRERETV